jgi:lipoprotein NlpI
MLKQYADAVTDFDQAIRLQPGYQNAYTNRAVARKMTGDTAGAAADQALARGLAQAH